MYAIKYSDLFNVDYLSLFLVVGEVAQREASNHTV